MSAANSLSKQLPWRRKEASLSQAELAEAAGLSRDNLANIESGRRQSISVDQLISISRALGVFATELVPELEPVVPAAAETRRLRSALQQIGLDAIKAGRVQARGNAGSDG